MLPDLIEIVPLAAPVRANVTVPGSKSITNRALVLAALSSGTVRLEGALWSEDTQVMVDCLQRLGFAVEVAPDPNELCNRIITVRGAAGQIPCTGAREAPVPLFVGNAGTAARFLTALVCLGRGSYRLSGVPRMHQRPQAALLKALTELGYAVESHHQRLPVVVHGTGPRRASCHVSIEESSQFASALLLCAEAGGWRVEITGENADESPYVAMTSEMVRNFPSGGGTFQIEPDASSGSYFWAANIAMNGTSASERRVQVAHWPASKWQIDAAYPNFIDGRSDVVSRKTDLGDSVMTAITMAALNGPALFTDLGRLRVQECERVVALRTELEKVGATVREEGDTLRITPAALHGAEIETYNDHRMAMCFAVLGLRVPGIRLRNPACVKKTFPNFFQKLAAPASDGLGVTILDAQTRAPLAGDRLFAD